MLEIHVSLKLAYMKYIPGYTLEGSIIITTIIIINVIIIRNNNKHSIIAYKRKVIIGNMQKFGMKIRNKNMAKW